MRTVSLALSLAAVCSLASTLPVLAAQASPPALTISPTDKAPVLDGNLDDAAWQRATKIDGFVQQSPRDGEPATEKTEVWVTYDKQNLYFGFYAHYSDISLMRANRADRDQIFRDDQVAVFVDPFRDQQRAYKFAANGYGVQSDAIVSGGGGGGPDGGGGGGHGGGGGDNSWDALYETKGSVVEDGFVVEMAIPLKSLRYPAQSNGDGHQWGFQIQRSIQGKNEEDVWAPVSRDIAGFLTQMGVLEGMKNLSTSKNLEILPTLTTVQASLLDTDTGAYSKGKINPDIGLNVKYGITSNLTSDFTYNPDFSQIESDRPQIDVNQRYPLYFEERRPFFLEGQEIFRTQINLIHTRTIIDPQYGTKLTGKVGNMSVGALFAADESPGKIDDPLSPDYVGRNANVFLGRVRYDLYAESHIGAIVTDREFVDQWSRAVGVDGRFRLGRTHNLSFMAVMSDGRYEVEDEEGGTVIKKSSGPAFTVNYRRSGRRLSYGISHNNFSPGFHTNLGFIRRVDIAETQGEISYRFWPQNRIISWGPRFEYTRNYDHNGTLQDEDINPSLSFEFARNIRFDMSRSQTLERYEDVPFRRHNTRVGFNVNMSRRYSVWVNWNTGTGIYYDGDPAYLGRSREGFISFTLRPNSRFETSLTNNISRMSDLHTGKKIFDVFLYRLRTTYQFSDRFLLRNIAEFNTYSGKLGFNLLLTYRVNAGTVLFAGYDDRLQRGVEINDELYLSPQMRRTNQAFFVKLSYLFRY